MKATAKTKCRFLFFLFLFILSQSIDAQEVEHEVYLLGNFVDIENKELFSDQLEDEFAKTQTPFTLILNGDLVNREIGKSNHDDLISPIHYLADIIQQYPVGNLLIIPGDRDWNSGEKGGEKSLEQLEDRVTDYFKKKEYDRCHWAVKKGCPGPEVFEINEGLVIAALNTQWWNHPYDKPRSSDALCGGLTDENLKEEIEDVVEEYLDRNVLIVGHHPVISLGNYGGYFSAAKHLLPPIIGGFLPAFHANVGNQFDLANARLQVFIESMKNLLYFHENLIYAAGHEHNQQLIADGQNYHINSGAVDGAQYAGNNYQAVYSEQKNGLIKLTYFDDGKVDASMLTWADGKISNDKKIPLFNSACTESQEDGTQLNRGYMPCNGKLKATPTMARKYPEPVTLAAGEEYAAGWWKRLWFGDHYRTSWTAPVTTNYLDLDDTFGGLTIFKKGGGRQTTSLKFKSGNGTEYTFRSVNKDPSKALNYKLRNSFAKTVIRDQTSSQAPYGSIVAASLLDEIGILHATPVLYRLPDDPKLGPFKLKYGGLFGMLEENPGKPNSEGRLFGGADKIQRSTQMFRRFYKNQNTKIQQEEFMRARLFDILVGDWSKHEDNWKWAAYEQNGTRIYRPIPRDRDHAFSRQDGIINWLADRPFGVQNLQNFGYKINGVKSYSFQPMHMDRFLMQEATKEIFLEQANYIQENISDEDIAAAVAKMPNEIYNLSGKVIEEKLKSRLPLLHEAAEKYYAYLSKEVDILGSKEKEYFDIIYNKDGSVRVQMFDNQKGMKGGALLYDRIFYPSETREVRLWGLGSEDYFHTQGGGNKIKVRAFGGPGDDVFNGEASSKTLFYDKGEDSKFDISGDAKIAKHWNKGLYEYDRFRFAYDYYLPLVYFSYSGATGLGIAGGLNYTVRRFQKDDYHSTHKIGFGFTTEGNKLAGYAGRFHQAIREWDFLVNASFADPEIRNRFFGVGNDSENLEDDLGTDYYQAKIATYKGHLGIVRDFWQKSFFKIQMGVERNESLLINDTYLSDNLQGQFGTGDNLTMLPTIFSLDLDFRDEPGLPYRGSRAQLSYENTGVVSDTEISDRYGLLRGDIEYYLSTRKKHPVTFGLRLGGAVAHWKGDSDAIPWYKLPSIGADYGLRGYVEQRFVGREAVFLNSELRFQFLDKETSFVRMKAGMKVFYDVGRAHQRSGNESDTWRYGYGFGFYLVPLNESITVALSIGFSEEERSGYPVFSIGKPLR